MRGLTFCDGYLPITITKKAYRESTGEFEDVTVWDETTAYLNTPSKYSSEHFPVVGYGTRFPFGMTLENVCKLYWRLKGMRVNLNIDSITATAGPASAVFAISDIYRQIEINDAEEGSGSTVVTKESELVTGPTNRFIDTRSKFEIEPSPEASEFDEVIVEGGEAEPIWTYQAFLNAEIGAFYFFRMGEPVYFVDGLYYPNIEISFVVQSSANSGTGDGDDYSYIDRFIYPTVQAVPTLGDMTATIASVPVEMFGESLGELRAVEFVDSGGPSIPTLGGDSSTLLLTIEAPPEDGFWGYGGVYDEDTGEKIV